MTPPMDMDKLDKWISQCNRLVQLVHVHGIGGMDKWVAEAPL
jgi:hypothetical protein